ncbi:rhodanese-like domain-containing protein [Azoarcus indigens]|uniref:Thiosulfate sulfurtransferase n=1 Tax=Azoarcus indigens TaxID=29545 RepID=A0A4R6EEU2_9RHOO|nr:rhodanese-like domain-containing protein [Azoarcus indigens]NMG67908.1 rhodanese-like domain-containing protein [Azoarcus indigens]TDN56789.1 thiosulfate sulfurtransferase [Azoarcus indigens]
MPTLQAAPAALSPEEENLEAAFRRAQAQRLGYGGDIDPVTAWKLVSSGRAKLVDVRTAEELKYVGQVPGSGHAPWVQGLPMAPNPDFLRQLGEHASRDDTVLLLCRSGKRSVAAAQTATRAGYPRVFSILEGFEGDLDATRHRGGSNGWRFRQLPWTQE